MDPQISLFRLIEFFAMFLAGWMFSKWRNKSPQHPQDFRTNEHFERNLDHILNVEKVSRHDEEDGNLI